MTDATDAADVIYVKEQEQPVPVTDVAPIFAHAPMTPDSAGIIRRHRRVKPEPEPQQPEPEPGVPLGAHDPPPGLEPRLARTEEGSM